MDEQVMKDLEAKVEELAAEFKSYALAKLSKVVKSGAGVVQDHEDNGCGVFTARQFVAAAAHDYADGVAGKLTKQTTHRIRQYRMHM